MKWAFKIGLKLIFARLPMPYIFWKSIGLFRHGCMDTTSYPIKIFKMHVERAYPQGLPRQSVILELGPGDSLASAIIAYAYDVKCIYLVDVGCYASKKIKFYQSLSTELARLGMNAPDLRKVTSIESILKACNAKYLTNGIDGLKEIPSGSLELVWSHSVLEHIRKHEFAPTLNELKRILKPGAYSSHNIDFQDHLDGELNNLRFSEKVWESEFFTKSGFYTNRIPALKMHSMFREVGFDVIKEEFGPWPSLPTPRSAMNDGFDCFSDEELINRTSHVLLKS